MSETPNQDDCRGTLVRGSDGVLSCPECGWRFEPGSPKSRMRKPTALEAKDAEIASLRAQLDEFKEAAERICRFDWSSNDPDAVRAIGALRFILHGSAK